MSTLGPEFDGTIAATLSGMELVRQVAAADVNAHAAGGVGDAMTGIPSQLLLAFARGALAQKACEPPAVVEAAPTTAEDELLSRSAHTFPTLPASRAQQTWHPSAAPVANSLVAASKVDDAQSPWRSLKRPPGSSPAVKSESHNASEVGAGSVRSSVSPRCIDPSSPSVAASSPRSKRDESLVQLDQDADIIGSPDASEVVPVQPLANVAALDVESRAECEIPFSGSQVVSPGGLTTQALPSTETPLKILRSLLLDAANVADWYPHEEDAKLVKASVLGDQVPQLLQSLEAAVMDAVLLDTVAELTRLDFARSVAQRPQGGLASAGEPTPTSGEEVVASFVTKCTAFEDALRQRYA